MNESALAPSKPVKTAPKPGAPGNGTSLGLEKGQGATEDYAGRSKLILAAVQGFRDGDFSVRLPVGWPGTEGRIAETFNQAIVQKQRMCNEALRLSISVGKEGRLRQRMSVPGAVGGWALESDAINTLIDDLGKV